MGMFDQVARYACKLDGGSLFQWILLPEPTLQRDFDSWDDTRRLTLPDEPDRTNDLVALFRPDAENGAATRAVVEVQTEPDRHIFIRLGISELLLLQEVSDETEGVEPPVFSVLLNLTGESSVDGWVSVLGRHSVRPVVVNLKNESASRLLDDIEAGRIGLALLPWVPLMAGGSESGVFEKWKQLASREPDVERRRQYRDFALIFAELSKKLVLWQHALEGWEMLESQLILGWERRGVEKGRLEARRADVLRIVAARLEDPVPEDLMLAVEGTNDLSILSEWIVAAATAPSIPELRKVMKRT